jgi:hypothetical protein
VAGKNPLGKIKNVAVESLKAPVTVAGSAVGLAKGAASVGGHATKTATGKAAGAVTSLVGGRKDSDSSAPTPADPAEPATAKQDAEPEPAEKAATKAPAKKAAAKKAPAKKAEAKPKKSANGSPEPVNVTQELGLDPAPVEKPKPAKKAPAKKPTTKIDAAADPSDVDVTPADVAKVVSKDGPADGKPAE